MRGTLWAPSLADVDGRDPVEWAHPLNQGRVLWLSALSDVAGGSRWVDLCGRSGATLVSGASWRAFESGAAVATTAPHIALLQTLTLGSQNSACAFWVRSPGLLDNSHALGSGANDNRLLWQSNTTIRFLAGGTILSFTVPNCSGGNWHRICVTRRNDVTRVFVGGVQSTTGGLSNSNAFTASVLGAFSTAGNGPIVGGLADVSAWNGSIGDEAEFARLDHEQAFRGHPDTLRRVRPWSFGVAADGASATGTSSLTFGASATGSSLVAASGSSGLTFAPSAVGSSLAASTGSAAITFTTSAVGSALVAATGTSSLTFTASAVGSTDSGASTGTSSLTFAASAVGSSLAAATGSSSLTFGTSATGSAIVAASGTSSITFAASAVGSTDVSASAGTSSITFTASAVGSSLASATGTSSLTFTASAVSGALGEFAFGGVFRRALWLRTFARAKWLRTFEARPMNDRVPVSVLPLCESETRRFAANFATCAEVRNGETLSSPEIIPSSPTGLSITEVAVTAAAFDGIPAGKAVSFLVAVGGAAVGDEIVFAVRATASGGGKPVVPCKVVVVEDH